MKKYIALVLVAVALASGAFFTQKYFVESYSPPEQKPLDSFSFTASTESTVLEAMKVLEADGSLSFSGREFPGLGFFVEEINGKRAEKGYYWILHINGKIADLGVSSALVQRGDTIEWRNEKGY